MTDNPTPKDKRIEREQGDVNTTAHRRKYWERNLSDKAGRWFDEDQKYFLHQSLSTPVLNVLSRADGIYIEDLLGKQYIDMHGKGATAFREQNNVPFMIYHPDIQGGRKCSAVTSHVDLIPTILAMTGGDKKQRPDVLKNLHGHDVSPVLSNPEQASRDAVRDGALYCFNMWSYMDAEWLGKVIRLVASGKKLNLDTMPRPDMNKRSAIRTVFDGRYKFSRYFNMAHHNQPKTLEQIYTVNDVELYDLEKDPYEMHNLGVDKKKNADLIIAMNDKMNKLIEEELGPDEGVFLPDVKGVNWAFDRFDI